MPTSDPIPVAQYLRMSTEHQQYAIENQSVAIADYAVKHGFVVTATYKDSARSGLVLRNRDGLAALLRDVMAKPAYKAILVFDVSRWGRFQDVDESAHYEFLCKSAGIPIHYCAEQFANDGSLTSLIVKSLKRAMAAEFSRELGEKVVVGKRRLVEMGFSVGGRATFGLRRSLVRADGSPGHLLRFGESKSLTTDRVVLVLGPPDEIATVKLIFKLVLEKRLDSEAIARFLNNASIGFINGAKWSRENVIDILRNPKYAGTNVWGRSTSRLRTPVRQIAKAHWITRPNAFPAIIDQRCFDRVQDLLDAWKWTDQELLDGLREVWRREGEVNQRTLCRVAYGPCFTTVLDRFGSFRTALKRIGYRAPNKIASAQRRKVALQNFHRKLIWRIARKFPGRLKVVKKARSLKRELLLDGRHRVALLLATAHFTSFQKSSWSMSPQTSERNILALCCLLSHNRKRVIGMYVAQSFPSRPKRITIHANDSSFVKLNSLSSFCKVMSAVIARTV